jgi:hypothetical protein
VYVLEFGLARYMFKNLDENQWKKFQLKNLLIKSFLAAPFEKKNAFWDITTKPKIGILPKLVRLEASTKSHVHNLIHEFLINMVFTMACPNFKKGMKMAFGPLRVKWIKSKIINIKHEANMKNILEVNELWSWPPSLI